MIFLSFIPSVILFIITLLKNIPLRIFSVLSILTININVIIYYFVSSHIQQSLILLISEFVIFAGVHILMGIYGLLLKNQTYKYLMIVSTIPFFALLLYF